MPLPCLVDTNILLRLRNRQLDNYQVCRNALDQLARRQTALFFTMQNAAEFWNVSTRPIDRNGHGLTYAEASEGLDFIESVTAFLPDNGAIYPLWRQLTRTHQVSGVQVHDCRLVAAMLAHGIPQILTLNNRDFARFQGIAAIHPATFS